MNKIKWVKPNKIHKTNQTKLKRIELYTVSV